VQCQGSVGTKGARLRPHHPCVALLVHAPEPGSRRIGATRNRAERERLRAAVQAGVASRGSNAGDIVRTAEEDAHEALLADMQYLRKCVNLVRTGSAHRARIWCMPTCSALRVCRTDAPGCRWVLIRSSERAWESRDLRARSCRNAAVAS